MTTPPGFLVDGRALGLGQTFPGRGFFDLLAKDFQVEDGALAWLRQLRTEVEASDLPNLTGKRVGIYWAAGKGTASILRAVADSFSY